MLSAQDKAALSAIAPLFDDDEKRATYGRDWTRFHVPDPAAIIFPANTEDVARILRYANDHDIAVVPSGGRTGLAGGAVAAAGELVVSLDKLDRIGVVDVVARTVVVGAGAITAQVHAAALAADLIWPIDLASKGSSQIGGNLSTNAGGVRVIRYGGTRNWVLGLVVALMDGRVLRLGGALEKNNTGYDLRQLFIGAEGTLGIITEATLKLTQPPGALHTMLFACDGIDTVLRLFAHARSAQNAIFAFEFFTDACLRVVEREQNGESPFGARHEVYALIDLEGEVCSDWMEHALCIAADGVYAQNRKQARQLWQLRENITVSLAAFGRVHKGDVAVPVAQLTSFVVGLESLFAGPLADLRCYLFGHIGDGNLHVNIPAPSRMPDDEFRLCRRRIDDELGALLSAHGGSISAEHGIGLIKRDHLPHSRTLAERQIFAGIKLLLDGKGLMNPGKILQ